jgi:tRNA(adenine34) deaminase
MRAALDQARLSAQAGEVPVGAVVVMDGAIVGSGRNQPISSHDPTAHAEILALRAAGQATGNYRLTGASLYVTVEPCVMCVGAMIHARVGELVFGAPEPKAGAIESTQRAHEHPALNHRLTVVSGVLAGECGKIMREFFEKLRSSNSEVSIPAPTGVSEANGTERERVK